MRQAPSAEPSRRPALFKVAFAILVVIVLVLGLALATASLTQAGLGS